MPRIQIPFMSSLLERSTSSLASRTYASRNGPQFATTYFAKRFIFFFRDDKNNSAKLVLCTALALFLATNNAGPHPPQTFVSALCSATYD